MALAVAALGTAGAVVTSLGAAPGGGREREPAQTTAPRARRSAAPNISAGAGAGSSGRRQRFGWAPELGQRPLGAGGRPGTSPRVPRESGGERHRVSIRRACPGRAPVRRRSCARDAAPGLPRAALPGPLAARHPRVGDPGDWYRHRGLLLLLLLPGAAAPAPAAAQGRPSGNRDPGRRAESCKAWRR